MHNPEVPGSIPGLATKQKDRFDFESILFYFSIFAPFFSLLAHFLAPKLRTAYTAPQASPQPTAEWARKLHCFFDKPDWFRRKVDSFSERLDTFARQ